jgi:hypothetical protein
MPPHWEVRGIHHEFHTSRGESATPLSRLNVRRLSCAVLNAMEGLAILLCLSGGRTGYAHGFYFYFCS